MDPALQSLSEYLNQTLSPEDSIRRPAEKSIESLHSEPGYSLLLLKLIQEPSISPHISQAAAIAFKNFVKIYWDPGDGNDCITLQDRLTIKQHVVSLMLLSPDMVQKQISDAISIIGKRDFPKDWSGLLGELTAKLQSGDFHAINGALQTAHSLFKKYRYEIKNQTLWEEIKFVLENFADPFTQLFVNTLELCQTHKDDAKVISMLYESVLLCTKIFHSLNYQELPDHFEENMQVWMDRFHQLLQLDNQLVETDIDTEVGVLQLIKSQVCDNVALYAQKFDEDFKDYLPRFVEDIWTLLVSTGLKSKYDILMCNAIDFLARVAEKTTYKSLFEGEGILLTICSQVILPNVQLRDTDEEQFEDNADEYIRRDLEGSDVDTRRHAACHLIKSLCKHFEEKVIGIFNKFIQQMLSDYQLNPSTRWRDKDAALFLILSLASRGKTERYGITKISGLVNITDIYWSQVASELKHNSPCYPMLEATAITYVLHFRSLLSSDVLVDAISSITGLLGSSSKVVSTYAAAFCEKILFMTNSSPQSLQLDSIKTHILPILANLIHMLGLPGSEDNEYAMKCVMRLIVKSGADQATCVEKVIPVLVDKLWKVSKNPTKPHFNHFLFEAIGASIRGVCTPHPSAVTSFEQCLFPAFEDIMVRDVLEFLPYTFQLLALMLELRDQPIAESYTAIFPLILSPMLWERIGTVPALSRLMQAFIQKCPDAIRAEGKVHAILGVFQKLLASKSNDHEGFNILTSILQYQGQEIVRPFLKDILLLCFKRLQESRTIFYVRGLTKAICSLVTSFGPVEILNTIDSIQGNLFGMLIEKVFIPEMPGVTAKYEEKRVCVVGVMQILTQTPVMMQDPQYQKLWYPLLDGILQLIETSSNRLQDVSGSLESLEEVGYQAAYSRLVHAERKHYDHLIQLAPDMGRYIALSLQTLIQTYPQEANVLLSGGNLDEASRQRLQCYLQGERST